MAVVEISVAPLGTGQPGVSSYVAGALRVLQQSGLNYQLNPMGTVIEGDLDEIFSVLREMHESPFMQGAERVSTLIKIDDRRDAGIHTMEGKVCVVKEQLKEQ